MLNRCILLGATLLGMAVPTEAQRTSPAQRGLRDRPAQHRVAAPQRARVVSNRNRGRRTSVRQHGVRHHNRRPRPVLRGGGIGIGVGARRGGVQVHIGGRRGVPAPRYRIERVWIPGYTERVWRPAEYGYRYDSCGRRVRVCIRPGFYECVQIPGRWEHRRVLVQDCNRGPVFHAFGAN